MSVEAPKVDEVAPVVTKPVETAEAPAETPAPAATEATTAEPAAAEATPAVAAEEPAKAEVAVETVPASEGVLGYKEPGFLKQFRYSKHHFWFNEEPSTKESLASYVRAEKPDVAHHNAAYAQETGKGVLFYSKRAEDKTTPAGMILLHDASAVTKVGLDEFSFKIGTHTYKFEAANSKERDSWIVAIEKQIEESKGLKEEVTGRDSYKKTLEEFTKSPVVAAAVKTERSSPNAPKKSLDTTTATAATEQPAATEPVVKADASSVSSSDEEKKAKKAEKKAKKERSQSRKRSGIFGILGKKDEEKEPKKEEKAEAQEEKEEDAKVEQDSSKAKEAAEATAVAAVPTTTAAVVAADKDEKKAEEKSEVGSPNDKKVKRASVFGSLFSKKGVTSPTTEKSEKEVGPVVPVKDSEVPPVSETAPKLDEPIENKPIDTAAVTAPVDTPTETSTAAAATTTTEPAKEALASPTAAETATTPKTEKKSFLAGLIKKVEHKKEEHKEEKKEEKKEDQATEAIAKEPVAATSTESSSEAPVETAVAATEAPKEERPAREKRRSSLFGSLGTMKRKEAKSPQPAGAEDSVAAEAKREKSPLPTKLGGLFRKPSKAVKSTEAPKATDTTPAATEPVKTDAEPATVNGETPAVGEATPATAGEPTESKIVGDVVPEELHSTVHDSIATKPEEVKASA